MFDSLLKLSHLDLDDRKFHKLVNICTVGNITVYVAKFEVYTQCSAASDCDFTNIVKGERDCWTMITCYFLLFVNYQMVVLLARYSHYVLNT